MSRKMRTVLKKETAAGTAAGEDYSGILISMYRR